ncbi:hypothetical protein FDUTEX481_02710 [Tolypothrix sp. PCC 7601]|nr:hypothetical protein FDUTEX481_02710 [Tolypothrix sp. PCC 7601]
MKQLYCCLKRNLRIENGNRICLLISQKNTDKFRFYLCATHVNFGLIQILIRSLIHLGGCDVSTKSNYYLSNYLCRH